MITLNTKQYSWVGFNPNGQGLYAEKSGGVPSSFSYLTSKVNTGTGKADSTVKWNLSIPIVVTSDSSCGCVGDVMRTYYLRIEVTAPSGSSAAERDDLALRISDLVASAEFQASVKGLTQPSS